MLRSMALLAAAACMCAGSASLPADLWEVPADAILAADFGRAGGNGGAAEDGWTVVDVPTESDGGCPGNYYQTDVGDITITFWSDWLKFYDRSGCGEAGDFAWDQVYTDYAYGVYGAHLYIELSGSAIDPDATYDALYMCHYDSQDGATMQAEIYVNGVLAATHTTDSDLGLIANNDPNGMCLVENVTADSEGKITIMVDTITPEGGGIRINGLILTPEPAALSLLVLGGVALVGRRRFRPGGPK